MYKTVERRQRVNYTVSEMDLRRFELEILNERRIRIEENIRMLERTNARYELAGKMLIPLQKYKKYRKRNRKKKKKKPG